MTAMQILERCKGAGSDKQALQNKITRYRESLTRATGALDGVGARGTAETDKMAAVMGEIDDLERQKEKRNKEYAAEVTAACRLLDMLPEVECQIVNDYYINNQHLTEIARSRNYSYGYVRNVKARACLYLDAIPEGMVAALLPAWYIETVH